MVALGKIRSISHKEVGGTTLSTILIDVRNIEYEVSVWNGMTIPESATLVNFDDIRSLKKGDNIKVDGKYITTIADGTFLPTRRIIAKTVKLIKPKNYETRC